MSNLFETMINRVILIVMDSVGVGYLPDARRFNDDRANTLLHIYQQNRRLDIPNLCALGIGRIAAVSCQPQEIIGCYGKIAEQSPGKDTTTGHWEIAGLVLDFSFRKDFSVMPPAQTLLDILQAKGLFTVGIGKIWVSERLLPIAVRRLPIFSTPDHWLLAKVSKKT